MKNNSSIFYAVALVIGDFLALLGAFGVAYILRVRFDDRPLLVSNITSETYLSAILIVLPLWVIVFATLGLYKASTYENRWRELSRLAVGSFWGMLVVIGYDFVIDGTLFPARLVAVYGFLLGLGFVIIFRMFARLARHLLFTYGFGINNVLIVGGNRSSRHLAADLSNSRRTGYRVVGIVGKSENPKVPSFTNFDDAIKKLEGVPLHSIIQTSIYKDEDRNTAIVAYAQMNHITYRFIPGNEEIFSGNIEVELFRGTPLVTLHQTSLVGWGSMGKRLFDFVLGLLLLVITSPIILLVIILMKLTLPRAPVFLGQKRLTQFDREVTVYKFRSFKPEYNGMSPEAAFKKMGKSSLITEYRENGDHLPNDPRITRLGRFMRITSIDELPQFWNVVRGDLSLVGPRALVPEELQKYQHRHHILSVRSGVTGLAQVSGRRDISFDERRRLDLYYVQNWSFWLDISILLRTFRAVINGIGAK